MFSYRDVPLSAYYVGIRIEKERERYYQIASLEKALCDKVYDMPLVSNIREMTDLLTGDLRIDEEDLKRININLLKNIAEVYPSTNVRILYKTVKRII